MQEDSEDEAFDLREKQEQYYKDDELRRRNKAMDLDQLEDKYRDKARREE